MPINLVQRRVRQFDQHGLRASEVTGARAPNRSGNSFMSSLAVAATTRVCRPLVWTLRCVGSKARLSPRQVTSCHCNAYRGVAGYRRQCLLFVDYLIRPDDHEVLRGSSSRLMLPMGSPSTSGGSASAPPRRRRACPDGDCASRSWPALRRCAPGRAAELGWQQTIRPA